MLQSNKAQPHILTFLLPVLCSVGFSVLAPLIGPYYHDVVYKGFEYLISFTCTWHCRLVCEAEALKKSFRSLLLFFEVAPSLLQKVCGATSVVPRALAIYVRCILRMHWSVTLVWGKLLNSEFRYRSIYTFNVVSDMIQVGELSWAS